MTSGRGEQKITDVPKADLKQITEKYGEKGKSAIKVGNNFHTPKNVKNVISPALPSGDNLSPLN